MHHHDHVRGDSFLSHYSFKYDLLQGNCVNVPLENRVLQLRVQQLVLDLKQLLKLTEWVRRDNTSYLFYQDVIHGIVVPSSVHFQLVCLIEKHDYV